MVRIPACLLGKYLFCPITQFTNNNWVWDRIIIVLVFFFFLSANIKNGSTEMNTSQTTFCTKTSPHSKSASPKTNFRTLINETLLKLSAEIFLFLCKIEFIFELIYESWQFRSLRWILLLKNGACTEIFSLCDSFSSHKTRIRTHTHMYAIRPANNMCT